MARKKKSIKRRRTKTDESLAAVKCKMNKTDPEDIIDLAGSDDDDEDIIVIEEQQQAPCTSTALSDVLTEQIEALLNRKKLVIIQGPCGCGKTSIAKMIAERRKMPINMLQINDQYDSKVLYGIYNCTEIPGEFVWQPSKFSQFIQQHCIILLENINHGSSDLIASIINLSESGSCTLSNGQTIQMKKECRILATISLDEQFKSHHQLRDFPYTVNMPAMGIESLNAILELSTPDLDKIREKIVNIFLKVSKLVNERKSGLDRATNAKDLFRASSRLNQIGASIINDRARLFAELYELWAMHLSSGELRHQVAFIIGEALSLSPDEQNYWTNVNTPEVETTEECLRIGRIKLQRSNEVLVGTTQKANNYVITRDSAQLLERIANCVAQKPVPEPVLLTGDTGIGKTAAIQQLAQLMKVPLRVVNLSQESEFGDLIGGYKPTSPSVILRPLADEFIRLFNSTFNAEKNAKFLDNLNKCFNAQRYADFIQLLIKSSLRAVEKLSESNEKRKKWTELLNRSRRLAKSFGTNDAVWRRRLLFAYIKGVLTEASEKGHWLLVDEINLASVECLDVLIELMESARNVIHPNFRLFACMNNANDVGKLSLPWNLRSRFTEFFVFETKDANQLRLIIQDQIASMNKELVDSTLLFYQEICEHFPGKFSFRTLSRALAVANDQPFSCQRSCLRHGCSISFISQLNVDQRKRVQSLVAKYFGKNIPQLAKLNEEDNKHYILIEGHKIMRGTEMISNDDDNNYIFTPSVKENMTMLAAVVATRRFPVLLEGETSAGKTSMIFQLAKQSGNRVYRINNHEHTDIQEYIGSYTPSANGQLEFVEGILLKAMRNGDWIILDELNLASSAVLEALNRLLDDNHELFVSELNIVVCAHPRFQLFATQNPVGSYGGRKRLSRAFLSRFMVLHWDPIPLSELPQIVHRRCGVSPKMAELMVGVLEELKARRAISQIFSSGDGLMTLRDLFRWGNRMSASPSDDWRQALADQGYFVLGARCRNKQDELTVIQILEKQLKRNIDIEQLFGLHSPYMPLQITPPSHIVLTGQLRRMLILCGQAWLFDEPVLLIGETGCGKTTVVYLFGSHLSINCHEQTDAADLLGSIRPTSDGLFGWQDGVVIQAMRHGKHLLIDEISLAPDSVLERLNSLLEPQRTILLTEGAASVNQQHDLITAEKGFQLVATMNPGNDHGKKELSKALRNRFSEIWCPQEHGHDDLLAIVRPRLEHGLDQDLIFCVDKVAQLLVNFTEFFNTHFNQILRFSTSIRDLLALAEIFVRLYSSGIPMIQALFHSIEANLLDALGVLPSRVKFNREEVVNHCVKQFQSLLSELELMSDQSEQQLSDTVQKLKFDEDGLSIGPFRIPRGHLSNSQIPTGFSLNSPTTYRNALRVARAFASNKPIMLEGSPGAGKSSLVVALAAATGHKLVRLNLSEQTDLHDLFGSDIPVSGGQHNTSTSFVWQDGPVLQAIKEGSWILLDELNLASQSVLEGLNSCFDFRKNIYIGELDRTFTVDTTRCKFFACQNPHQQGGARRALPKSFLNRFISIFIDEMTDADFIYILCEFCKSLHLDIDNNPFTDDCISKMVLVNKLCREQQCTQLGIQNGGPFEFNLRDLFRWVQAIGKFDGDIGFGFDLVYLSRLTKKETKEKITNDIYNRVFSNQPWVPSLPLLHWSQDQTMLQIGHVPIRQQQNALSYPFPSLLMASQLALLERIAACVVANWLVLLTGPSHVGKRSTIRALASLIGRPLETIKLTAETDTLDLLGSFEQTQIRTKEDDQMESGEHDFSSNLRFEWVDSVFVRAYRDGHWLLIEDVNCCSSAVLDCLNSCLESPDGELVLPVQSQNGSNSVPTIRRHENFRLFFTMDPLNGPLSRAMRNRAVEITICTYNQRDSSLWSANPCDAISAIFSPDSDSSNAFIHNSKCCPASNEQIQMTHKFFHALNASTPRSILRSAAQLPIDCDDWFGNQRTFQEGIQKMHSLLLLERDDLPNGGELSSADILGLNNFPPLIRFNAAPTAMKPDLLTLYYWRCWSEVSSIQMHPDISLCLAFIFPSTIPDVCSTWSKAISAGLFPTINDFQKMNLFKKMTNDLANKQKSAQQPAIENELLEITFPEETRRWKDPEKFASNETESGKNFLALISKISSGQCGPFLSRDELERCQKQWYKQQNKNDDADDAQQPIFGRIWRYFDKLFQFLDQIFDANPQKASLSWKDGKDGRIFEFSFAASNEAYKNSAEINTLFSHLQLPFMTVNILRSLWSPLHFDDQNILHQLRIGELSGAETDLDRLFHSIWELTFARKSLCKTINTLWKQSLYHLGIEKHAENEDRTSNLAHIIVHLTNLLRSLTPPKGFIDPPYFLHLQQMFWHERLQQVDIYLASLQSFLQLTVGTIYSIEQIVGIGLSSQLFLPVLSDICYIHRKATENLGALNSKTSYYALLPLNDRNKNGRHAYRFSWSEQQETLYEKHFQHELLNRLTNTGAHLFEAVNDIFGDQTNGLKIMRRDNSFELRLKLRNLLDTILSLKIRLTTADGTEIPPTICAYPEIVAPYLNVLSLLAISITELDRQLKQHSFLENAIQKYRFSQNEYIALKYLLSPPTFDINGGFRNEMQAKQSIIRWIQTVQCPLTVQQKLPVYLWSIAEKRGECIGTGLKWILQQWECWHEENARIRAEEQLIVIKKSKKQTMGMDSEEEDIEEIQDPDELQIRKMLPDFSCSTFDDGEPQKQQQHQDIINGSDLHNALHQISKSLMSDESLANSAHQLPFLPFMQIIDKLDLCSAGLDEEKLAYRHLFALHNLREFLQHHSPSSSTNVYQSSDPAALLHCLKCLTPLYHRLQQLLAEFPENTQLNTLKEALNGFMQKAPASAPLMKHAAQLEHILVRAEEWESIADRAHSIRQQMIPLQELLVDWRRREVHCWAELISFMRADRAQLAVLAGWPLFKFALDMLKTSSNEDSLVLMFIDWMHNSNLGDFEGRLWSGWLLARCLPILDEDNGQEMASRLRSVCAHFEQFVPAITELFDKRFRPIESELRDFCKVVRYTDLNMWSVRDSAKRAHTQLFRILRKFKELCNESLSPLLLDKLPQLSSDLIPADFALRSSLSSTIPPKECVLSRSINAFIGRLDTSLNSLLDLPTINTLKEDSICLLNTLQTEIKYNEPPKPGANEEIDKIQKANEKLHGTAQFERQQHFSHLVRAAGQLGLAARKAHHIDSEQLTMQTLNEATFLEKLPKKIGLLFRNAVASRNVFLRQFAAFRRHQHPNLPPATIGHLRGLTEFTLHWVHNALSALGQIAGHQQNARIIARCYDVELKNAGTDWGKDATSHAQMSAKFTRDGILLNSLDEIIGQMCHLLRICPSHQDSQLPPSLHQFQEPLGQLRQTSSEHAELTSELAKMEKALKWIKKKYEEAEINSVDITDLSKVRIAEGNDVKLRVWDRTSWNTYLQSLGDLKNLFDEAPNEKKLTVYFAQECKEIGSTINQMLSTQLYSTHTELDHEIALISDDQLQNTVLIFLQTIHEESERNTTGEEDGKRANELGTINSIKKMLEFLTKLNIQKVLDQLFDQFYKNASFAAMCKSSPELFARGCSLIHGLESTLGLVLHQMTLFIAHLASFHMHWISIGCHLLAKGFVNRIPEIDQRQKGADQRVEEAQGFGDSADFAPDAKDVSGQVENMEQIEGLRGNQQEGAEGGEQDKTGNEQEQPNMSEVDQPIDVDDDFAGCLEGLDAAEEGEEGQNENDDREQADENQAEWNFGELEEPEETQLDPKLWETEKEQQENQRTEEAGSDEAQQEKTDELAAKQKNTVESTTQQTVVEQPAEGESEFDAEDGGEPDGENEEGRKEQTAEELEGKNPPAQMDDEDEKRMEKEEDEQEDGMTRDVDDELMEEDEDDQNQEDDGRNAKERQENDEEVGPDNDENGERNGSEEGEDEGERRSKKKNAKEQQLQQNVQGTRGEEEEHNNDGINRGNEPKKDKVQNDEDEEPEKEAENEQRMGGGGDEQANDNEEEEMDGRRGQTQRKEKRQNVQEGEEEAEDEPMEGTGDERMEDREAEVEADGGEQNKMSAHASATLEQALRTRSLFDSHLRRFRQQQQHETNNHLATEATEDDKAKKEGQRKEENEDDKLEGQEASGNKELEGHGRIQFERQEDNGVVFDPMIGGEFDCMVIDKLCAEFDKLEQQQQGREEGGEEGGDDRELELKWALITDSIAPLAAELTESLRAIIDPTIASKLEGDYRTGKRLNMRRLITYIASDYRKDRIWMRRTKKTKRNYQICIAVDNSESMRHNHMTEITCNALCLIERALRLLEVGQLALCSFGSRIELLQDFGGSSSVDDPITPLGVRILRQLRFDQQRTDLCQLLTTVNTLFRHGREGGVGGESQTPEQMLIILGDGRGVFTEGVERIRQALAQLAAHRVTVLYLVLDIVAGGDYPSGVPTKSITEMRVASFAGGQCTFRPYMQQFPFPLYALVRNTRALPATISEAVRQWFDYTIRG